MSNTLIGMVVGIDKGGIPIWGGEIEVGADGEAVVLGGDVAATGGKFDAGLVVATVAVFELVGVEAGCTGKELVTEADSEDWAVWTAMHGVAKGVDGVGECSRVAWAVGDEDGVGLGDGVMSEEMGVPGEDC